MTVGEIREALAQYPADAKFRVAISIPDLYINTVANASITGNTVKPEDCSELRFVAMVPERMPNFQFNQTPLEPENADANTEGAVQEG